MSQETPNLRWTVRRIWTTIGGVTVCGLLAGAAIAALQPPTLTSTALIILPAPPLSPGPVAMTGGTDPYTATQEVIATSYPVLTDALPDARPVISLDQLRHDVQAGNPAPYVISITAESKNAADAEATANAVARSYVAYVSSPSSPVGRASAQLLVPATSATGTRLLKPLLVIGLIGVPAGALIGIIMSLAIGRRSLRLRRLPQ